ncbi:unnamed protein product [Somion occarium]|uniref:Zn(2)-C6 fungal-type domain-containing protein n=1 Tax=Somion occarium TaxID=3059160 RepID=A0ABP1CFY4_9APHY
MPRAGERYIFLARAMVGPPPHHPPITSMSALNEGNTPAQDGGPPSIDTQQLHLANDLQQQQNGSAGGQEGSSRKPKAPSVRRACTACHAGKTRCSDVLPCQVCIYPPSFTPAPADVLIQSCLKRGLGNTCAYPDPEADNSVNQPPRMSSISPCFVSRMLIRSPAQPTFAVPAMPYPPPMHPLQHPQYYDYSNSFGNPVNNTIRPTKRPRPLTEEETAAITRNFTRGDFFVGSSAPVRIDPRLPVRLTLAEGDQVHFSIGEGCLI